MKKYSICFLLFVATSALCLTCGYVLTRRQASQEYVVLETTIAETAEETQAIELPVANIEKVEPVTEETTAESEDEFYLVSEAGFLLVFQKDRKTICLYTHIPITDFPQKERERLMEGIGFSSMMEVFNYLESYTS